MFCQTVVLAKCTVYTYLGPFLVNTEFLHLETKFYISQLLMYVAIYGSMFLGSMTVYRMIYHCSLHGSTPLGNFGAVGKICLAYWLRLALCSTDGVSRWIDIEFGF
jgi:hypothetical protein